MGSPSQRVHTRNSRIERSKCIGGTLTFRVPRASSGQTGNYLSRHVHATLVVRYMQESTAALACKCDACCGFLSEDLSGWRLGKRFPERFPIVRVPSPFEVLEVAFRKSCVIEDDGGF